MIELIYISAGIVGALLGWYHSSRQLTDDQRGEAFALEVIRRQRIINRAYSDAPSLGANQ